MKSPRRWVWVALGLSLISCLAHGETLESGRTDQKIAFRAIDASDHWTPLASLTNFTVRFTKNGGTPLTYTSPTVAAIDNTNQPGLYVVTLDEGMTIDSGADFQECVVYFAHAGMDPAAVKFTLARPKFTVGQAGTMSAGTVAASGNWNTTTPPTASAIADAVWDELLSTGHDIDNSASDILRTAETAIQTANTAIGLKPSLANIETMFTTTLGYTSGRAAKLDALDDLPDLQTPPTVPVSQVAVGASRTWKLVAKGTSLVGELPLFCSVDDDPVYAIDFSVDLPTNGRLTDFESIEIVEAVDADGETIEDPSECLEFDTDGADTFGVDKSLAKLKITALEPGTYTLKATVEYRDGDGGGTRRGKVVLKVGE